MFYIVGYNPKNSLIHVFDDEDDTVEWVSVADLTLHYSRLRQSFASEFYTEDYNGNTWGNSKHQRLVPFEIYDLKDLSKEPILRTILNSIDIHDEEALHGERYADVVSVYNDELSAYEEISFLGMLYHDFDDMFQYLKPLYKLSQSKELTDEFIYNPDSKLIKFAMMYYRERLKLWREDFEYSVWEHLIVDLTIKGVTVKNKCYCVEYVNVDEARYCYFMIKYFRQYATHYSLSGVEGLYPQFILDCWAFINGANVIACKGNTVIWQPLDFKTIAELSKYKLTKASRKEGI